MLCDCFSTKQFRMPLTPADASAILSSWLDLACSGVPSSTTLVCSAGRQDIVNASAV